MKLGPRRGSGGRTLSDYVPRARGIWGPKKIGTPEEEADFQEARLTARREWNRPEGREVAVVVVQALNGEEVVDEDFAAADEEVYED